MARRGWLPALAAILALAACGGPAPTRTFAPSVPPSHAQPSVEASASGGTFATPGTPYITADVLAAMRDSRRPGGVPDELKTDAVAGAVAEQLWTWDGQPWATWTVGGACGPDTCSLDVAGDAPDGAGTDLYTFTVDPATGAVELASTDLHGYPPGLEARLDAIARDAIDPAELDGLTLVSARWLPPPETDRYWLAYRSGGEEGAPRLDVVLDLATGVVSVADPGG